ncbi:MAG: YicC family protein [Calditrichaeota bacterium]|nr:YicC family protein [Calditrichota bacterium]
MPRSMTGYGVGRADEGGLIVSAEVRSVNNRFLDLALKLPRGLYPFEGEIRDLVRQRLERGRVSLGVNEEWSGEGSGELAVDRNRVALFAKLLRETAEVAGINGEVRLADLFAAGDFFIAGDVEDYRHRLWETARRAIVEALDELTAAGRREADHLARDLRERLSLIRDDLAAVERFAAGQAGQYRARLEARLGELLDDARFDRSRLETEVALAADRLDISEETVRLASHVAAFEATLGQSNGIGKRLNFLLQEMGREVNTIGSKAWLLEISQAGVRMKETLEQMREQVQNLE